MQSKYSRSAAAAVLFAASVGLSMDGAQAETRVFQNPRIHDLSMDRCRSFNRDCDWPAANAYCAAKGYARAVDWIWAVMGRTRTIGSGETCTTGPGTQCGGFLSITCDSTSGNGVDAVPGTAPGATTGPVVHGNLPLLPPGGAAGAATGVIPGPESGTFTAGSPGTAMPAPSGTVVATFGGTLADYTIRVDPASGNWVVQDGRPGGSGATYVVGANVATLAFADTSIAGPAAGAAPPASGMTPQELDNAFEVTGFTPTPGSAESTGSGAILARLERGAYDCRRTGPSNDRLYTRCALVFSLTNTTSETLLWTSGRWHTANAVRPGMDERGVPYGAKSIRAGEKVTFKSFCIVPTGQGRGTWAAWGSAAYPESQGGATLTWRLTTTCP